MTNPPTIKRHQPWRAVFTWKALIGWVLVFVSVPWRRLWRAIEVAGDVEFLMSLGARWPILRDLVMDWGWIPLMIFGFVWLGHQVRASVPKRAKTPRPARVLYSLAVAGLIFGSFVVGRAFPYVGALMDFVRPINALGFNNGVIHVGLDMNDLVRYSDEYEVLVVCGVHQAFVPPFEAESVVWSRRFPIKENLSIDIPVSEAFAVDLCKVSREFSCNSGLSRKGTDKARMFSDGYGMAVMDLSFCANMPEALRKP